MIKHEGLDPSHPELRKQRLVCVAFGALALSILLFNLYALSLFNIQPTVQYQLEGSEHSINKMINWPKIVEASRAKTNGINSLDLQYLQNCWTDKEWLRMV